MSRRVTEEQRRALTGAEIATSLAEPGLGDWRHVLGRLRTRYRTGTFAAGLALVDAIGSVAEAVDHHPDIGLTYGDVVVSTYSHDVRAVTVRDVELARAVAERAAGLGVTADPGGVCAVEWALDTARGGEHAAYYAALLGCEVRDGEPADASAQAPGIWWQPPGDPDDEDALPVPDVPQRWHPDVWVPVDEGPARVAAALAAGGRLVSDAQAPSFWVLEDPDGNRACVCTAADRA